MKFVGKADCVVANFGSKPFVLEPPKGYTGIYTPVKLPVEWQRFVKP